MAIVAASAFQTRAKCYVDFEADNNTLKLRGWQSVCVDNSSVV